MPVFFYPCGLRTADCDLNSTNLEGKIDAIGYKLDYIKTKDINKYLEIESKLNALIEDNKSICEVLGEHEISIRTLRRRPV